MFADTKHEKDVRAALKDYEACPQTGENWIPAKVLWRKYTNWWTAHRRHSKDDPTLPGRYPRLTPGQFGRALRRICPGIQRVRKERLRIGKRVYGYRGVRAAE